jgi:hypothetical protein
MLIRGGAEVLRIPAIYDSTFILIFIRRCLLMHLLWVSPLLP